MKLKVVRSDTGFRAPFACMNKGDMFYYRGNVYLTLEISKNLGGSCEEGGKTVNLTDFRLESFAGNVMVERVEAELIWKCV